jgi:thymidine kinase
VTHITRIFGPPGTGKTTTLINIVEETLASGVPPEKIAYVSFSKKAVEEAISRAQARFGFDKQRFKYFRTLHSLGFMMQGMRSDSQMRFQDYKAISDGIGMPITEYYDDEDNVYGNKEGDHAMNIHSLSRLKMISPQVELATAEKFVKIREDAVLQWIGTVEKYKKTHGKHDFTDMLESYKGALPVHTFIVDEAQDLSKLQWWVVEQAAAIWRK